MVDMNQILQRIEEKKKKLDSFRPFAPMLKKNIDDWLRIELTYNSNAIEGNTLSRAETMLAIVEGITAKGKSLVEHLEAINHAKAFDYIVRLVENKEDIPLSRVVMDIHSMILDRINDEHKGRYRNVPVRIAGSSAVLPNYMKVPDEMEAFYARLNKIQRQHVVNQACIAHFELVRIHPFIDGNGRTARLLMNYLLINHGYAPALVKKEERKTYIDAVEEYSVLGKSDNYYAYMYKTIERGLDEYLKLFKKTRADVRTKLLKIGELATRSGVSIPTIRHWTKEGLLEVADYSKGGYQLYSESMKERVQTIQKLQDEGFRLDKIKMKILSVAKPTKT